ncbi:iron-regulated protein [Lamprobacter modestohalophilus]|uniref:Iron-regulated protein n=2 Tax=Lamprobacter modestohalophilus TaxID=1064514 RepID=A0A9X1B466_9GAMM|nr:iron-regulated protein [Lamprobacter modestohalophilus]MCF8014942.1 ChaN family lipoprotein [Chromatiaceae bacterium]
MPGANASSAAAGSASPHPEQGAPMANHAGMPPAETAIHPATGPGMDPATKVLDLSSLGELDGLIKQLVDKRVVFIGESHDRYEDHLNQLEIIRGLHERGKPVAIGMEFFQQPFQDKLDAYIAGDLSEEALLRETEYFERWRFDYRLYRPILRYAREHGLPLIALNLPREITEKVGDGGIASLSPAEAAMIPSEIDREAPSYRAHLQRVFEMHPNGDDASFEHFLEVQLLWDEGMAERAVRWLQANPESQLIVLAGAGHVEYGRGIPSRVKRRLDVPMSIVMSGQQRPLDPEMADFLLYPQPVGLPKTGLMGVMLDTDSEGQGVAIQGFAQQSGARDAGVKEGDRIIEIGDTSIDSYADIRIALMDSRPGQQMPIAVLRDPLVGGAEQLSFDVTLK